MTGKLYVIFDPLLAQSAFRSPQLSLLPIAKEAALKRLKLSEQAADAFRNKDLQDDLNKVIKASSTGVAASEFSRNSLKYIAEQLNRKALEGRGEQKVLYTWVRDMITTATIVGLFGFDSILNDDPKLLEALW